MKLMCNSFINLVLILIATVAVVSCNGAGNQEISSGTLGLRLSMVQGDNQVVYPLKSPDIKPMVRVLADDGSPAAGIDLEVKSTSTYRANILANKIQTDANGLAEVPFTGPVNQGVDFQVTINAVKGNLSLNLTFSTPETSPSTRFVLKTTKGTRIVAGEKFGFIVSLINEDGSLYRYSGPNTLLWQYTVTNSWTAEQPYLPANNGYQCTFVNGVCTTPEDFWLTDTRQIQLISVGDGDIVTPGQNNYIDAYAIEVTVLTNIPTTFALSSRPGGPNEGAIALKSIKRTADGVPRDYYASIIDEKGNFITDGPSSVMWEVTAPNPLSSLVTNIRNSIVVHSGTIAHMTFTPNLAGEAVLVINQPGSGLTPHQVPNVLVTPGKPYRLQISPNPSSGSAGPLVLPANTFQAGSAFYLQVSVVDAKGNQCTQVLDNIPFSITSTKITDRFGPVNGGGANVYLYSQLIADSQCGELNLGWCGAELSATTFVSWGGAGVNWMLLSFSDIRFHPELLIKIKKTDKPSLAVLPDFLPNPIQDPLWNASEFNTSSFIPLTGDLVSNPVQISLYSNQIPVGYALQMIPKNAQNQRIALPAGEHLTYGKYFFLEKATKINTSRQLFAEFGAGQITPNISVKSNVSNFDIYAFYYDSTGNMIFNLPGTNSGKPNCDTSNAQNLVNPDTAACAAVPLTFERSGVLDTVSSTTPVFPEGSQYLGLNINPRLTGVGSGIIEITDPNYPNGKTYFAVDVQPSDLDHFRIFAKTTENSEQNIVDASTTYDLYIDAYDFLGNKVINYNGAASNLVFTYDRSEITNSPKGTAPIFPPNKASIKFTNGRYILTGLRLPAALQTLKNLRLVSNGGQYESKTEVDGELVPTTIDIQSRSSFIDTIKVLNYDPLNSLTLNRQPQIDFSEQEVEFTADERIEMYVVAYDSELNPTKVGLENLATQLTRVGDLFGSQLFQPHSVVTVGNTFFVDFNKARSAPYTGVFNFTLVGGNLPHASAPIAGIKVKPGVENRYNIDAKLPYEQLYLPPSPEHMIAGESPAGNPPWARVCILDKDLNIITDFNGTKNLTFVFKSSTFQQLSANRYQFIPDGIKQFYQGCVLDNAPNDVDISFMLYEAGPNNQIIVSDGTLIDGSRKIYVYPNVAYKIRSYYTGNAIVGIEKQLSMEILDQWDNRVNTSNMPIYFMINNPAGNQQLVSSNFSNQGILNYQGVNLPTTIGIAGKINAGLTNVTVGTTLAGALNYTIWTDANGGTILPDQNVVDYKPDIPVALTWNPSMAPFSTYSTSAAGWPTIMAELIDQYNNVVSTNNGQSVALSLQGSHTTDLLGALSRNTNTGQVLFNGINYMTVEDIKLRATHNATGFYVEKNISVVQGNPKRIILTRDTQTLNTGVSLIEEAVSGTIGSPLTVNYDDSSDRTYTFKAYIVDDTFNKVPGWGGFVTPVPDDPDAVVMNSSGTPLTAGQTISFDAYGAATFKVKFRTAGVSQKIGLNCNGFISPSFCHSSDNFTVNPGPVKYLVPLLGGQILNDPGKLAFTTAVSQSVTDKTANTAHSVTVYAVDNYHNIVNNSNGDISNLQLSLKSSTVNDALTSNGGSFSLTNGAGMVSAINYHASSNKTLVVNNPPAGVTATTSTAYVVVPGVASKVIAILPNQTHVPGSATYASAVTGTPSNLIACANQTITFRVVDDRFNLVTSNASGISFSTSDPTDVETTYSGSFVSGEKQFTYKPVRVGNSYSLTPLSVAGYAVETPANYNVTVGTSKKLLALLNGQVFTGGFLNETDSVTGSILVTPTAGVAHNVRVIATDSCHNQLLSATESVAITSTDANDTHPANQSLIGGQTTFSITNTTAAANHTTTVSATGHTSGTTANYTVVPNSPTKILAFMPGQTYVPGKSTEATAVTGSISARTVNTDYPATIRLTDNWHNTVSDSSYDSISISGLTTDLNDTDPSPVNLSSGVATLTLNHKTATVGAGTQTVTFASSGSVNDTFLTSTFIVSPAAALRSIALLPGQVLNRGKSTEAQAITGTYSNPLSTAGSLFTVTAYVVDAYYNVVTSYSGAKTLSTSDPNDTNPSATFASGTATYTVTNTTRASNHTVTVLSEYTNRVSDPYFIEHGVASQAIAILPNQTLNQGATSFNNARTNNTNNSFIIANGTSFTVKVYVTDANYNIIQNDSRNVELLPKVDQFATFTGPSTVTVSSGVGEYQFQVTNYKAGIDFYFDVNTVPNLTTRPSSTYYKVLTGAATQMISVFPGQNYIPGASTLATAVTGTPTASVACIDSYSVGFYAVDSRFNTVAYSGSFAISTSEAGNPQTGFSSQTFASGTKSVALYPTNVGTHTLSITASGSLTLPASSFNYMVGLGASKYLVPILQGETLSPGRTSPPQSGTIINPIVGSTYNVASYITDQCFNILPTVTSVAVTLTSADPYDVDPVAQTSTSGTRTYSFTHTTATTSLPQASVTQHKITSTATGLTVLPSSNYIVDVGPLAKHLVVLPGETYATPGKGTARTNVITGTPSISTRGTPFTANVYATDNYYNKITTNTSALTLTSIDAGAAITPSGSTNFVSGAKALTVNHANLYPSSTAILTSNDGTNNFTAAGYTVIDVLPSALSYTPASTTMTKGTSYTFTPSSSGGPVVSYAVTSGTLPAGLTLNTSTGVISGTPTTLATSVAVTVTAYNSGGSNSKPLTFVVNDVPPSILTYSGGPDFTWESTQAAVSTIPTSSGGTVDSYERSGTAFPTGISLNASTGLISGTPTQTGTFNGIIITATNTGGSTQVTLNITVNVQRALTLTYSASSFTYVLGGTVNIAAPTKTGGEPSTYTAQSGTLPAGLTLNSTTGDITGTVTAIQTASNVTIRGSNVSGSADVILSFTVNDKAPVTLTYSGSQTWTKGSAYSLTPSVGVNGGTPTSYSITTAGMTRLPGGVSLNTSTGVISGTPIELGTFTPTVTATNITGSTAALLTIVVNDVPPSGLSYTDEAPSYTVATSITNNSPSTSGGGLVISYSISPALPQGLSFSTSTGVISGTPRVAIDATNFVVTATNSGGSTTKAISMTIRVPQYSNLLSWWRAEDNASVGSGANVMNWTDAKGSVSLTHPSSYPNYYLTSGKNLVTFSAQNLGTSSTDVINGSGNKTIIVAYKTTSFASTNTILSFGNDVNATDYTARSIALTTNGTVITNDAPSITLTSPLSAEGIVSIVFASDSGQKLSDMLFYHQGTAKTHNGPSSVAIDFGSEAGVADFAALGARLTNDGTTLSSSKFTGSILEVLVFDTNLSTAERSAVECHLYYKHGLASMGCP